VLPAEHGAVWRHGLLVWPQARGFGLLFSLVTVAESWGLFLGGVCMDPKTAQVGVHRLLRCFLVCCLGVGRVVIKTL
jgi:hypothetical protein